MGRSRFAAAVLAAMLASAVSAGEGEDHVHVAEFSDLTPEGLPPAWEPLTFPGIDAHTRYRLVSVDGGVALRADADASASGLVHPVEIDPQAYPVIEWRWKVASLIPGADVARKSGDDYPARIYVAFLRDGDLGMWESLKLSVYRFITGQDAPTAALNYIWDGHAPAGTVVPNAYTDAIQMIVVESGAERLGEWVTERRNIVEDFREAFGRDPPTIVGVAVMTDADNTGAMATAWYGDITFRRDPSDLAAHAAGRIGAAQSDARR
jgi:hypothetical protein